MFLWQWETWLSYPQYIYLFAQSSVCYHFHYLLSSSHPCKCPLYSDWAMTPWSGLPCTLPQMLFSHCWGSCVLTWVIPLPSPLSHSSDTLPSQMGYHVSSPITPGDTYLAEPESNGFWIELLWKWTVEWKGAREGKG